MGSGEDVLVCEIFCLCSVALEVVLAFGRGLGGVGE